jgi:hypothetical protein
MACSGVDLQIVDLDLENDMCGVVDCEVCDAEPLELLLVMIIVVERTKDVVAVCVEI